MTHNLTTYSEESKTNLVCEQILPATLSNPEHYPDTFFFFLRVLDLKYYLSITLMSVHNPLGLEFPIILNNFNIQ